jgi:hypothetical protein
MEGQSRGVNDPVERLSLDVLNPGPTQESYPLRFFTRSLNFIWVEATVISVSVVTVRTPLRSARIWPRLNEGQTRSATGENCMASNLKVQEFVAGIPLLIGV